VTHAPAPDPGLSPSDDPAARARLINARLSATYGPPPPIEPSDPLEGLIGTILSQHTSDANSARAFAALLDRFGSLEAVRVAPVEAIEDAIRHGGLARVKAGRIKEVLERVHAARGKVSLDFLRGADLAEARAFLTGLSGVGPKTAACVLLFDLGLPAIPVDTHVHRVSRRLGLIGPKTTAAAAHALIEAIVPPDQAYAFHLNLIRHGRRICKAVRPRCSSCPLEDMCPKVGLAPAGTVSWRGSTRSSQEPSRVV
jgi:endonuclease-3